MSKFTYVMGMTTKANAERCYLSEDKIVQLSVCTPKKKGRWGKSTRKYYVAEDKRSPAFGSEEEVRKWVKDKQCTH